MIDIKILRESSELVKKAAEVKRYAVDVDRTLELDARRRELQGKADDLRALRNEISDKMKDGKPEPALIEKGKKIKTELAALEADLSLTEEDFLLLMKQIPNLPAEDVPIGKSEDDNVVTKTWGEKPQFDFEPKNHAQIAEAKGWLDKERAAKVAGARFAYLKGDMVRLQFAIIQYVFDVLSDEKILATIAKDNNLNVSNKVFVPLLPPFMIKEEVFEAMDRLDPREERYKVGEPEDDLWLQGSAEHTMGSMYYKETLQEAELPIRYIGYATSFRREAGTYGKDMEGILRMHQFDKLEMESFTTTETSYDEHLFLIAIQEYLMQSLGIHYHVLMKCTADIGKPNARGVDIEAWLPSQNKFRETHSADYMTDYQARRMHTRVKREDGTIELIHTNDATAMPLSRGPVAILENYQRADGSMTIPEVLRLYLNNRDVL
jgi:seryl-tRNA synthetase